VARNHVDIADESNTSLDVGIHVGVAVGGRSVGGFATSLEVVGHLSVELLSCLLDATGTGLAGVALTGFLLGTSWFDLLGLRLGSRAFGLTVIKLGCACSRETATYDMRSARAFGASGAGAMLPSRMTSTYGH